MAQSGDTGIHDLRDGVLENLEGMRRILEGRTPTEAVPYRDRVVAKFKTASDALDYAEAKGFPYGTSVCEDRHLPFCVVRL